MFCVWQAMGDFNATVTYKPFTNTYLQIDIQSETVIIIIKKVILNKKILSILY